MYKWASIHIHGYDLFDDKLVSVIIRYTISTPMLSDARDQAIRRAHAEGYSRVSVTSVKRVAYGAFEVTLVVTK